MICSRNAGRRWWRAGLYRGRIRGLPGHRHDGAAQGLLRNRIDDDAADRAHRRRGLLRRLLLRGDLRLLRPDDPERHDDRKPRDPEWSNR